jgi:hypothetical protein
MIAPQNDRLLVKNSVTAREFAVYERLLAHGIKRFISELCLTNAGTMITYICANQHDNIDDIIASSAELYMKPGTLRYAQNAEIDFEWGHAPLVTIDMNLCHPMLTTFFRIVFDDRFVGVDIRGALFRDEIGSAIENMRCFTRTLAEALVTRP